MADVVGQEAAEVLTDGLGRRKFMGPVAALGALSAASVAGAPPAIATGPGAGRVPAGPGRAPGAPGNGSAGKGPVDILQPGRGRIRGDHYLSSTPDEVLWGYVPTVDAAPVMTIRSGRTVTIDTLSHEGILEDQGRDPLEYFGALGVGRSSVLEDAVDIAAGYRRTERRFDVDGPHIVTGPIAVEGAEPGDVLKIETLEAVPRVP
ncbi:hypothetical protein IWX63_001558 [Arthrobacter sp. CAN_A2]|uniref:hypothetical protein n=1 Tax=Arthrobacter sp. CAN_A2 TaxID=2787718 RepID=UPI001A267469